MKKVFYSLIFIFSIQSSFAQFNGSNCLDASGDPSIDTNFCRSELAPFCSGFDTPFCNSHAGNGGTISAQAGIDYSTTRGGGPNDPASWPFPTWFFIKIENSGDLVVQIEQWSDANNNGINDAGEQQLDVDFICWGPFGPDDTTCDPSSLTNANKVDGSWLPDTSETMTINNVVAGQTYVLMISNFSQGAGVISLTQDTSVTNPATTDCSIVAGNLGLDQNVCEGTTIDLDGTATSTGVTIDTYQWQLSTDDRATWTDIAGEINPMLSITNDTSGIYRVIITDTNGNDFGQNEDVEITFVPPPTIDPLLVSTVQCQNDDFTITATTTNADTFTWQVSEDGGTTFNNITASANYADFNTNTLQINNVPNTFSNFQYQLIASNSAASNTCETISTVTVLTVNPLPSANALVDLTQCENDDFTISAVNVMNTDTFEWEVSEDGGTTWAAVIPSAIYSGQTTNTLSISDVPEPFNNNQYRVILTNSTTMCSAPSNAATLTINPLPTADTLVDLTQCEDDDFTIEVQNVMNADTFEWEVSEDGGATWVAVIPSAIYSGETTNTLSISDVPFTFNNNQYRVRMTNATTMCTDLSNTATLTVNPQPTADALVDITQCENDDFTIEVQNVMNADTFEWEVSEDGGATWAAVMPSAIYSGQTTNTLSISDVPFIFNNNQYRVRMTNATTMCTDLSNTATLTVNPQPTADALVDITQCENDDFTIEVQNVMNADTFEWEVSEDGGATWAAVMPSAIYSGQTTNTLSISDVPFTFNNNQYRVVLTNSATTCTNNTNALTLTVNPLPTVTDVAILQCDNDADLISDVNLTLEQPNISTNSVNENFEYFESLAHAQVGAPVISNPVAYNASDGDQVWVRTYTDPEGCYRISRMDITISFAADVPYNRVFIQCDDFLDFDGNDTPGSNDDTDGLATFDFSDARTDILNSPTLIGVPNLDIKFFETIADRASEINELTNLSSHRNNNDPAYANNQTIYAKIINTVNNDCTGLAEFTLEVTPVPTATSINVDNEFEDCDNFVDGDATNGIIQSWDLDSLIPTILGTQNPANYTVTFHETAALAASGMNPLASPYTNITRDRQTIYVRVAGNGCAFDRYTFDLVVNSLPTATELNMANTLEVCDNDDDGSAINGFVQNINLDDQTATILGSQDPANYIVTYHTSLALAQANGTAVASGSYSNQTNTDIVYVRIENRNTGCVNDTFNFTFLVNTEPLGNTPSNLSECDNDADGDDANGFVQTFDLESQIPNILGDPMVQDEDDFNVTFHLNQTDATSGNDPQSSPFTNTDQNGQTIYVRIENKATGCVNDDVTFDVIVNPLPEFSVTTPQTICLNNTPLTLVAENPNAVYTYEWFDASGTPLGASITQDVTTGGEYTVIATTTSGTMCPRALTITVEESNIATITEADVTIVDDSDNNSITINNSNLGPGNYEFALINENGIVIRDYQTYNIFEGLEGGIYTINVRDVNGCGVATLTVPVIEFPKFFTPNGDGIKDTWAIKGVNPTFFPEGKIYIFNRQGKVVAEVLVDGPGWNGLYNNAPAPSNDYWFNIQLIDNQGNVRNRKGHFSLLRR